jgi:ubiquinone/menaquinone biosynthesis C-methylase UbiE
MLYDHTQAVMRRLFTAFQLRTVWLNIPPGGIALDVGCGTGSVTASLARAAGPDGLALGVDISEPMLARAVRAEAGPQIGFLRADAQRLPLRDETVDAVISVAVLQLIPDPAAALAEMARVLRPGGLLPGCCGSCRSICSARTKSATSWRTAASSAYGPRVSALSSGCAGNADDTRGASLGAFR